MKLDQYFAENEESYKVLGPPARHLLVYGPPKSGKTAAVGKLAKRFKLRWFDNEDSIKTLANGELFDPSWRNNVDLVRIPDKQTYPMAIETMLKVIKYGPIAICHLHGKMRCPVCKENITSFVMDPDKPETDSVIYVLDSYSQLVNSALNYIMKDSVVKENYDAKPGWDEWGKLRRILERIDSSLQSSPFNWVIISHEMMTEMEDKNKKIVPIGGTENASKVFGRYFDEIIYCEIVNSKHKLVSGTTSKPMYLLDRELEWFLEKVIRC
jgi:hypothetical protein